MENDLVVNPTDFERKKKALMHGGARQLHVVADFDKTLTTAFHNGEKRNSLVEIIRKYKYLSPEYVSEAYGLYEKYHPMEIDLTLDLQTKKSKMLEWWTTHVKRMSHYGLNREIVERIVREQPLNARPGLGPFLDTLNQKNIPLLILSAGNSDFIEGLLKKEGLWRANIHVVANQLAYDDSGRVMGYKGKIIHSLNKSEAVVKGTPYEGMIRGRRNVILLGDNFDDVKMLAEFDYDTVIKVGFLNDHVDDLRESFSRVYDVLILHDGPIYFVNQLIEEIK
ncbi:MAG: haloacid dehalogenase-like hydrolase [Candidatus Diapherotrites archaeon]|nr:haloacid dehalogenase-like hydrolase [Candidatus Diapherotrites archaeon]MDZ4256676.1 haloacid dehalogenase-like hydrolase [archaeon]